MITIEAAFKKTLEKGDKAFVPYIMAGDGGLETLKDKVLFLEEAGATAIELGIPFSDPVADGPIIQAAGIRSLEAGTTLRGVFETIQSFRSLTSIPLVIMTYLNPVLAYGPESFFQDCEKAAINGLIVPDLPVEEEVLLEELAAKHNVEIIRLVTLTSPIDRIENISKKGKGFLYAVTVTGITGSRTNFQAHLGAHLLKVKEVSPIPVLAGFGISSPEHVASMAEYCDGVIVGSRIVELFSQNNLDEIKALIAASKKGNTLSAI
ncbi:tryptophan synthase subunit alpha [Cytobacillus oceanisediminis]|uniref:Tryptophan synthase alpha chain n=1 Tax=Niallia alba TaxID=2729105 RepID=A0A7Y0KA80_9BACI|nr:MULTISPECIES: tryptophan synthase subunit alpha [Bacillaceae]MBQ6446815.1 tryptophan synthase subunit alpha [Bacillus sp. (in: firmicutes)]MBZ9534159.1 tryptophan synthase subunit alpha [Cytobacillus oceanisediminis]NMO78000.1 tryptophan synthase subunit alpha [Niallia alba]UTI41281.1 tryptophan synthase subunit alpha [Niallia sp. RD1]